MQYTAAEDIELAEISTSSESHVQSTFLHMLLIWDFHPLLYAKATLHLASG